jgi:hypothetical protein
MNQLKRWLRIEVLLLLIVIIVLIFITVRTCHRCSTSRAKTDSIHWANWNIMLPKVESLTTIGSILSQVETNITNYLAPYGYKPVFKPYYCPCDSLLVNLDVTIINESGGSKVPPTGGTSSTPTPGGGGHFAAMVNYNYSLSAPTSIQNIQINNIYQNLKRYDSVTQTHGSTALIAVLDTGIDTTFARLSNFNQLIINDPSKLYDFLPNGAPTYNYDDDTAMKHGTIVTAIIVDYLHQKNIGYPMILPLKIIDSTGKGSIFSASCALSYAVQQHASVINASWGYYGAVDSILQHYIGLCNQNSIPVIAAAGNVEGVHNKDLVSQKTPNPYGLLSPNSPNGLFYPACFSKTMPYVVSVTGLNADTPAFTPCYYQNYSPDYVTVGVLNKITNPCCSYLPKLSNEFVEGSSFAAPVITANMSLAFLPPMPGTNATGMSSSGLGIINGTASSPGLINFVQKGLYIPYTQTAIPSTRQISP